MARVHVLLVEDDAATGRMLSMYLSRCGYAVTLAPDAESAMRACAEAAVDAVVLDVVLPDVHGWSLIGELRRVHSDLPVLFLTAMAAREDELRGLGLGGDDYLRKPVDPPVLQARLEAVLARSGRAGRRTYPGITVDFTAREVLVDGKPVALTRHEFDLLAALAGNPQRVFTRSELLDRVWGRDFVGTDRVVDTRLNALRRKLGEDGRQPRFIAAVRGVGYRFLTGPSDS
jgi:two-component system, OmpR family, alkaline phosphatase synthesis response regulator PhoP